jgi:hypothetical protein
VSVIKNVHPLFPFQALSSCAVNPVYVIFSYVESDLIDTCWS